jgi:hypothetical protein
MDETQLLAEIRDLLKEQNRLMAEIKAQNDAAMARNAEHMAKAEAIGQKGLAQGASALSGTGWIKWGFWIFLALLILLFAVPAILPLFFPS